MALQNSHLTIQNHKQGSPRPFPDSGGNSLGVLSASATEAPGAVGAATGNTGKPDLCAGLCWSAHHSLPEMTSEGEPAHTS